MPFLPALPEALAGSSSIPRAISAANGGTGPLSVHFGVATGGPGYAVYGASLTLGGLGGNSSGNVYLSATGNAELVQLMVSPGKTADVTTTGNLVVDQEDSLQVAGDNLSLASTNGSLVLNIPTYNGSPGTITLGSGNLALIGNEIDVTYQDDPFAYLDQIPAGSITSTGSLLYSPGLLAVPSPLAVITASTRAPP